MLLFSFVADGYDITNKIIYEYIGLKDYYSNSLPDEALTPDEIDALKNNKFGEFYFVILKAPSSGIAKTYFNQIMYRIKNADTTSQ